jgi:hypothetical protein
MCCSLLLTPEQKVLAGRLFRALLDITKREGERERVEKTLRNLPQAN